MSREIRFRAWDGKQMVSNVLPWSWDAVIQKGTHRCVDSDRPPFSNKVGEAKFEVYVHMINDVQVMQYTGLKDKNGVEIYEGDIVSFMRTRKQGFHTEGIVFVGPVVFGKFNSNNSDLTDFIGFHIDERSIEYILKYDQAKVIGNIHENEDLLNN